MSAIEAGKKAAAFAAIDENIRVLYEKLYFVFIGINPTIRDPDDSGLGTKICFIP
jgi:hypothetical protein